MSWRPVRQSSPSTQADRSTRSETTPIMWDPPNVGSSCREGTVNVRLPRSRFFDAPKNVLTEHTKNLRAGKMSAPMQQQQISQPLRFPLWHSEHVEQEEEERPGGEEVEQTSERCSHRNQDDERMGLRPESLARRLLQAERGLAEKDQRIEALEGCTRKLVDRLELAEGLTSALPKEREKQPSTPASTRSTSGSTSWTNSELVRMLPRNRTIDSLGSVGSGTAPATPKTPSTKSHFLGPKSTSSEGVTKRQAHYWGANSSPYASAADVDVVCRRSELLLKAMTAVVVHGEKRLPRQTSPSAARNSPRSGELRSSSKLCF